MQFCRHLLIRKKDMSNILIGNSDNRIKSLFDGIERLRDRLSLIREKIHKRPLYGQVYITERELSVQLKISRRTLQEHRDNGKMPYYQIGGKILYKASDVQRVLDGYYRKGFDLPY